MINKIELIGNVGQAPEIRTLENGQSVARLSVATNESWKDKNGEWQTKTEWHNVVAWRDLADRVASKIEKGMLVYIEGKMTYRKYQNKDGVDVKSADLVARVVKSLERKPTTETSSNFNNEAPQGGDNLPF